VPPVEPLLPRVPLLDDEPRLDELRPDALRDRLELDDFDEPDDFDLLRDDPEEPPERLFDPEALPRPERLDPVLERELREPVDCCCSLPLSSSSPLISFLATVTAAGTAIPTAAPASAFLPVERPSCSLSFAITSLLASLTVRCLLGPR
jgi:hypothetical protein